MFPESLMEPPHGQQLRAARWFRAGGEDSYKSVRDIADFGLSGRDLSELCSVADILLHGFLADVEGVGESFTRSRKISGMLDG